MLALQFAARRRYVTLARQLAPHRTAQALEQLRQPQCVLGVLGFAVEQAGGHAVAHQLPENAALQLQQLCRWREVGLTQGLAAEQGVGAFLEVHRQLALQRW